LFLYKYLPFNENSLKVLTEGTIKFTKPSEFNDPFDCAPDHKSTNITEYIIKRPDLIKEAAKRLKIPFHKIKKERPRMIRRIKKAIEKGTFGQPASDAVGICSLSRDPLNLLMWAHYSKEHTGFVVEFNIPTEGMEPTHDLFYFENLISLRVNYTECKPAVDFFDDQDTKTKKQFLTKGVSWKYEQEERVIDYVRGDGIHRYAQDSLLNSVLTGMKMESSKYKIIQAAISAVSNNSKKKVGLHKVCPVDGKFEISVPDRPDINPLMIGNIQKIATK